MAEVNLSTAGGGFHVDSPADPNFRQSLPFFGHPSGDEAEKQRREMFKDPAYTEFLRRKLGLTK